MSWKRKTKYPPGPRGDLVTGTAMKWRPQPLSYMQDLVREHGPAVRFHYMLGQYGYLFTHPDHYEHILLNNYRNYTKQHPIYRLLQLALGGGLITLDPPRWRAHRRIMQPAFHRAAVSNMTNVITRHTETMLGRWDIEPNVRYLDVSYEMTTVTLGVMVELLFGHGSEDNSREVSDAFSTFSEQLMSVITNPWAWYTLRWRATSRARAFCAVAQQLRNTTTRLIATRPSRPDDNDLLAMLLATQRSGEDGLTDEEIRDEIVTMLLAGHETSATALTWTFYLIATHQQVEHQMREELQRVVGGGKLTFDMLAELSFTRAVAQEALRLFPPVYAFSRCAVEADQIGEYDVSKGAAISLCPYITHRMPEFWSEPERFMPERFTSPVATQHKFAFLPFAAGPRRCIGEQLAMTEIVAVLATVLARYRLFSGSFEPIPDPRITLRPRFGMPMIATRVA